ncbi:Calx-beta domain-containing protein [Sphingomonas rubra]|uniref:Calx-beta domain-containing protein n=1 Tax=Sphingomonas rubra TaxID=634430 RepID=A0A1I5UTI3_9SPHN|nr:hypothetical protein [Sphingomonas rubra]SFP98571.1 hypothetical protein SAMN04488241_1169 [Sphingomonas rubra]
MKAPLSQTLYLTEDGSTIPVAVASAVTIPPIVIGIPPSFDGLPSVQGDGTPQVGEPLVGIDAAVLNLGTAILRRAWLLGSTVLIEDASFTPDDDVTYTFRNQLVVAGVVVATVSVNVVVQAATATPTPTPPPSSQVTYTRADSDESTNPPRMRLSFPDNIPPSELIGKVVTFRRASNGQFNDAASLAVTLSEAHFDGQSYSIDREVDIDLSELMDNAPAGPFFTEWVLVVPDRGSFQSPVYSATLNSPPTTFNVVDAGSVLEGNSGSTDFAFPVSAIGALGYEKKADWTVVGIGTNPAGAADFVATTGTVTIPAGQDSATLYVQIVGDTTVEQDETFKVVLSNVRTTGYAALGDVPGLVGASNAEGTIANDDAPAYTTNLRWSDADSATYAVENGGLTARGYGRSIRTGRGNIAKSSGKWWIETTIEIYDDDVLFGLLTPGSNPFNQQPIIGFADNQLGVGFDDVNKVFFQGDERGQVGARFGATVVIQALDLDTNQWHLKVGGAWKIGNGDTGVGGIDISGRDGVALAPTVSLGSTSDAAGSRVTITSNSVPAAGYAYL